MQIPFNKATEGVELMHQCCPQHLRIETAKDETRREYLHQMEECA